MIIKRHDFSVNGSNYSYIVRYLRGAKCYLLIGQRNCADMWSEVFDTRREALEAFEDIIGK